MGLLLPALLLVWIFSLIFSKKDDKEKQVIPTANEKESMIINQCLDNYFKDNDRLIVVGDVNLRPISGNYGSLLDLYVYFGEDCICSLMEFKDEYQPMYEKVIHLLLNFANLEKEQETSKVEQEEKNHILSEIGQFIEVLHGLNQEIESEEISNGLYQTCAYLKQMVLIEKNFNENKMKSTKVTQYYLPMLVEILNDYKKMSISMKSSQEFIEAEDKVVNTIVLINEALQSISMTVCELDLMTMNVNMKTLEMLLRKDGLIDGNPFEKKVSMNGKE